MKHHGSHHQQVEKIQVHPGQGMTVGIGRLAEVLIYLQLKNIWPRTEHKQSMMIYPDVHTVCLKMGVMVNDFLRVCRA